MDHLSGKHQLRSSFVFHLSRPVRILIKRFSFAILVLLALFAVFLSKTNSEFGVGLRTQVTDSVAPASRIVAVPVDIAFSFKDYVKDYFFVHKKNEELRKEIIGLKTRLAQFSSAKYENIQLKKLLNFAEDTGHSFVSARVVGDTSGPFIRSILLNAGESTSIKKGQAVTNETGLVGRITEVGKKSSRVLLLTDINSKIPVISNQSRQRSIMIGKNNEDPALLYLQKDTSLKEGELIETSGDGNLFPPGLQVGVVYKDKNRFNVRTFTKWHNLENLTIISTGTPKLAQK